jgi:hypothetical protein
MDEKQGVWVLWIGSLAMMLLGSGWVSTAGRVVFWVTLAVHFVECFMNLALFRRAGRSMANQIVQNLSYGLFYWTPLKERLEAEEA